MRYGHQSMHRYTYTMVERRKEYFFNVFHCWNVWMSYRLELNWSSIYIKTIDARIDILHKKKNKREKKKWFQIGCYIFVSLRFIQYMNGCVVCIYINRDTSKSLWMTLFISYFFSLGRQQQCIQAIFFNHSKHPIQSLFPFVSSFVGQ